MVFDTLILTASSYVVIIIMIGQFQLKIEEVLHVIFSMLV